MAGKAVLSPDPPQEPQRVAACGKGGQAQLGDPVGEVLWRRTWACSCPGGAPLSPGSGVGLGLSVLTLHP